MVTNVFSDILKTEKMDILFSCSPTDEYEFHTHNAV